MRITANFRSISLAAFVFGSSGCGRQEYQAQISQRDAAAAGVVQKLSENPLLMELKGLLRNEIDAASASSRDLDRLLNASDQTKKFIEQNRAALIGIVSTIPVTKANELAPNCELTPNEVVLVRIHDWLGLLRDPKQNWPNVLGSIHANIPDPVPNKNL